MLAAVAGVPERFAALGKRLFEQWRDMVVHQTLGPPRRNGDPPGTAWVGALVDAAAGRAAPVFRAAVSAWLDDLARNRNALIESVTALATLTRDLSGGRVARCSPALVRALGHVAEQGNALQPWRHRVAGRHGSRNARRLEQVRRWRAAPTLARLAGDGGGGAAAIDARAPSHRRAEETPPPPRHRRFAGSLVRQG